MSQAPNASTLPQFTPSVGRAYAAITSSPNALMNVVWLSLAALLSGIWVGMIPVLGWGAEMLQRRCGRPEYEDLDVDSDRIGDYLGQGIWPFVVYLVASFVGSILMMVPMLLCWLILAVAASSGGDEVVVVALFPAVLLIFVCSIPLAMFLVPLLLRAQITQDFGASFDFGWSFRFIKMMFGQLLLQGILFYLSAFFVTLVGLLLCGIGYIPAAGLVFGASQHLLAQLYECYLSRGGEPVPPRMDEAVVEAELS